MSDTKNRVTVLGIGNPLCQDDGIGIRIIYDLHSRGVPEEVDVIDGGTSPDLLSLLNANIDELIIVDALKGKGKPGTIYRLEIHESNISDDSFSSVHGLGVLDGLKLMKKLGIQPDKVVIIGIEPEDTSHGLHISPQIESRIPAILDAVEQEIRDAILK
ncbi:MAG: hydrogenase maturation protease [Chloroflexi bacterium]|nr:hydrogenase maturation protease [Chloroflexota bacterium]